MLPCTTANPDIIHLDVWSNILECLPVNELPEKLTVNKSFKKAIYNILNKYDRNYKMPLEILFHNIAVLENILGDYKYSPKNHCYLKFNWLNFKFDYMNFDWESNDTYEKIRSINSSESPIKAIQTKKVFRKIFEGILNDPENARKQCITMLNVVNIVYYMHRSAFFNKDIELIKLGNKAYHSLQE